jgi:hypothetical protein
MQPARVRGVAVSRRYAALNHEGSRNPLNLSETWDGHTAERTAREGRAECAQKDIWMLRSIVIDIIIVRGNAGLIHARSWQMRSLMLMGRSEEELWRDMDPILRDLLDIQGDKVATMTIDRPGRRVRVDVE